MEKWRLSQSGTRVKEGEKGHFRQDGGGGLKGGETVGQDPRGEEEVHKFPKRERTTGWEKRAGKLIP